VAILHHRDGGTDLHFNAAGCNQPINPKLCDLMVSGWLLLAGGAFWTLNSLGAGVLLGHWLARHRLPERPDDESPPAGPANQHDRWSPLAGEVARGVAQAGAAVRKAEWLSSVCDEASPKPPATIRTAVRELAGAVRNLHVQVGSIFAAFESLRSARPANEGLPLPADFALDEPLTAIDLIGRRRRLGAFEPPPPPMRFPYHCRQWVAPCLGDQLPPAKEFFPVQCRHLDKDGVAFYVNCVLPAETFVISMGTEDDITFMFARVLSEHAQPPGAQGKYMLQCRFVRHIEPGIYIWNPVTGAIEPGEKSVASLTVIAPD
jgi:hypothetical protein